MEDKKKIGINIYDNALGFANAYRLLYEKTCVSNIEKDPTYVNGSMIMPTLVNGAFACELFLKALLEEEARGHSLVELFEKLQKENPDRATIIECTCITILKDRFGYKDYEKANFLADLNTYDIAFEKLRYWHEPDTKHERIGKAYNLAFMETLVAVLQTQCQEIYGERPSKRRLFMVNIFGQENVSLSNEEAERLSTMLDKAP